MTEPRSDDYAKAQIRGEIANDPMVTSGGLYPMKVKVSRQGQKGNWFDNYIPVAWFGKLAESTAGSVKRGTRVVVNAAINTRKQPGDQYPSIQLVGEACQILDEQDSRVGDEPGDGIPF